jgi:hypothetical protein
LKIIIIILNILIKNNKYELISNFLKHSLLNEEEIKKEIKIQNNQEMKENEKKIENRLIILTEISNLYFTETKKNKEFFVEQMKYFLECNFDLIKNYISSRGILELYLKFMISIFNTFRANIPLNFIESTINLILELLMNDNLIWSETSKKNCMIESLLELLKNLLLDGSGKFVYLTPNILAILNKNIFNNYNEIIFYDLLGIFYI